MMVKLNSTRVSVFSRQSKWSWQPSTSPPGVVSQGLRQSVRTAPPIDALRNGQMVTEFSMSGVAVAGFESELASHGAM